MGLPVTFPESSLLPVADPKIDVKCDTANSLNRTLSGQICQCGGDTHITVTPAPTVCLVERCPSYSREFTVN